MMTTRPNPATFGRSLCRDWLRAYREMRWRLSFHVRAWLLGFEIRHGLPV